MVVLETSKEQASGNRAANGPAVKQGSGYGKRLLDIMNRIHAARNVDEILIDLKDEIVTLFEAERLRSTW